MNIRDFFIDGKTAPLDVGQTPVLSWKIESAQANTLQTAYRIRIMTKEECPYDSGIITGRECVGVKLSAGLLPFSAYTAKLTVWDNHGCMAEAESTFETGRWDTPWQGHWITGEGQLDDDAVLPTYHFRKEIRIKKPVKKARLYASALGCYTVSIGGTEVSPEYFAPGYAQYTQRILYNTYSVTRLMQEGVQQICAEVSGGWYCGRLGLSLKGNNFGKKRAFRMELRVTYMDETQEVFSTDHTWQVTTDGPRRFAGFFDGEVYDARREEASRWSWSPVTVFDGHAAPLEPHEGVPVLLHERLHPVSIRKDKNGNLVCDFGRNIAGVVALRQINGKAGQQIRIRHGEVLHSDGTVYTGNLRTAKAALRYTCRDGVQSYLPRFTYMGFRYAEISGLEDVTADRVCACALYSDMRPLGSFSCSNAQLNQLQQNIVTSQKANFMDIPTDCPQRDERSGWTGDIAMFIPTANFNMDTACFMRKWLRDVELVQNETGVVTHFVPNNGITKESGAGAFSMLANTGAAAWGDAATIVPWEMYWATGDISFLERQYDSMVSWVEYELQCSKDGYIWDRGFQFGDWLAPGESIADNMGKGKWTATAYFARSAWILAQAAKALGKEEEYRKYADLFEKIRASFCKAFLDTQGHIRDGFQTIYVLGIRFDLLRGEEKKTALQDLLEDIRRRDNHLGTGFVGTPFLPFVLSDCGQREVAYRLLLQETPPGWLYPISCGATSIWERWDALKEDGTVNSGQSDNMDMVSFNHYAYGAIGDWMYKRIAGLEPLEPGYRTFRLAPQPGGNLVHAQIRYMSPHGLIESRWEMADDTFRMSFCVPCNTEAEVVLPDGSTHRFGSGRYTLSCNRN